MPVMDYVGEIHDRLLAECEKAAGLDVNARLAVIDAVAGQLGADPLVALKRAEVYLSAGQIKEAVSALGDVFSSQGHGIGLLLAGCSILATVGLKTEAMRRYPDLGIKERPQDTLSRLAFLKLLGTPDAMFHMRRCLARLESMDDFSSHQLKVLAEAAASAELYTLAVAAFERFLEGRETTGSEVAQLAQYLMGDAQPVRAAAVLRDQRGTVPDVLAAKARYFESVGDNQSRFAAALGLLRETPASELGWAHVAEVCPPDQLAEAEAKLRGYVSARKQVPHALFYALGTMNERLGRFHVAFSCFAHANKKAAVALRPGPGQAELAQQRRQGDQLQALFADAAPARVQAVTAGKEGAKPLFIVGMPRSGKTVLERLLGCLPEVSVGGERSNAGLALQDYLYDRRRGQSGQPQELTSADWDRYRAIWRRLQPPSTGEWLTNTLPQNMEWIGWLLALLPEAKVICMDRDARDMALGIYQKNFKSTVRYATDPTAIASRIKACTGYAARWEAAMPESVLRVRFEDLVNDPSATLKRVGEFCGMDLSGPESTQPGAFAAITALTGQVGLWRQYEKAGGTLWEALAAEGLT